MSSYQRKDHFHQRAKREGLRSRAAYKLAEIDRAHRLLCAGQRVLDLGSWPGGWLQVTSQAVGLSGRVVGVDVAAIEPAFEYANVITLCADFTQPAVAQRLLDLLEGPADVLLSDAAPKLTGVRATDRAREEALLEAIEALLPVLLRAGGDLLVKLLESPEAQAVDRRIRRCCQRAKTLRPRATRKGSAERYLLGRGFRPPEG